MQFTPWVLFQDFALMSILLLVGQLLRVKVPIFQKFMLPASLIAGFIALAFGPNGLGYIPFSRSLGTYSAILIVLVFAALPIGTKLKAVRGFGKEIGEMWSYVTFGCLSQYGWAMLLSIFGLGLLWELHPGFGYMLATGFFGGHGTAAAVGASFKALKWDDALSLGMTSATVGVVAAMIGGVIMINWGARRGWTRVVESPDKMVNKEMLTGLLPPENRKPLGTETTSGISIESFTFHLSIILLASWLGYYGNVISKKYWPDMDIPAFCIALFAGYIIQWVMEKTGSDTYVDAKTMNRIGNICTDYLIVAGVAAIRIPLVVKYAAPLAILFLFGMGIVILQALWMGPRQFGNYWFERSMFCYGFNTGTLVNGIMLLRMVDPESKSKSLETYAVVGLLDRPLIVALIALGPALIASGYAVHFAVVCSILAFLPFVLSKMFDWWHPDPRYEADRRSETV
jgi:ESS family glutamate:Na+ symporter